MGTKEEEKEREEEEEEEEEKRAFDLGLSAIVAHSWVLAETVAGSTRIELSSPQPHWENRCRVLGGCPIRESKEDLRIAV